MANAKARLTSSMLALLVIIVVAGWLFTGAVIMWSLSALHEDWASVPALGYVASLWSQALLVVLGGAWSLGASKS